jgi:hypothetical protein
MADLPAHPDKGDADVGPAGAAPRRKTVLAVVAVVALIAVFLALHLTGVIGPESH